MTILDKIMAHKRQDVELRRQKTSVAFLEATAMFQRECLSLSSALRTSETGVIAEFKRKSPSESDIHLKAQPEQITLGYQQAGACALSVLTDTEFFGGSTDDLMQARAACTIPILRKDFIVDPYQVYEAKAMGADAILLIAASLSKSEMKELADTALAVGLEVLTEVHAQEEIEKVPHNGHVIGVNNRNLKTFTTRIEQSIELQDFLPSEMVQISESGIKSPSDVMALKAEGFQGFLIGTLFMKQPDPAAACASFIQNLKA